MLGVGKSWAKSANVYNWGGLLARGTTLQIVFLIWACWLDARVEDTTDMHFWVLMKWSFDIMFAGVWPHKDWNGVRYDPNSPEGRKAGKPLVGAVADAAMCFFCVLWRIKGDLDFYQKEL